VSDVVLHTDVASAILKAQLPDTLARRLAGQRLAITFVTVGELTQWTYLHRWGPQRRAGLRAFFASVVVLPGSFQAATV
jgi:toxin FitB